MHTYRDQFLFNQQLAATGNTLEWFERGVEAYSQLWDIVGEQTADAWWDAHIKDGETCKAVAEKISRHVVSELMDKAEAAHDRIDRSEQAHPGAI